VSLTLFASDTIGIGTRFRASINLGVYDKVYRAFPVGGRGVGGKGGRTGTVTRGRIFSCRLLGSGCGIETSSYRGIEGVRRNCFGESGVHEYRWQVRVVLGQPSSCILD